MPNNSIPQSASSHQSLASIEDVLLDTKAAAAYLGLSVLTLADWRCKGEGPAFIKTGRYVKYRRSTLSAWLDSRTFTNTTIAKEMSHAS